MAIELIASEWLLGYIDRTERGTKTDKDRAEFPIRLELAGTARSLEPAVEEIERRRRLREAFSLSDTHASRPGREA